LLPSTVAKNGASICRYRRLLKARIHNISSGGAYFCLDSGVYVGSKLNLIIDLPKELTEGKSIKLMLGGITVRLAEPDSREKRQGVAVRFSKDFKFIPEEEKKK